MKVARMSIWAAMSVVLTMSLTAPVSGASSTAKDRLVERILHFKRTLTEPAEMTSSQRTLVALNFAAAELQVTDPDVILQAYQEAGLQVICRTDSDTSFTWNGSAWVPEYRTTYTYDGQDRLTGFVSEDWNGSAWENSLRVAQTYNGGDFPLTSTVESWETDHWENQARTTFTFSGGLTTVVLIEFWDGSNWVDVFRTTTTYDGLLIATSTTEFWQSNVWVNSGLTTYSYDGSNRNTEILTQAWQGASWVNVSRITFTYDGSGRVSETVTQFWTGSAWMNTSKIENTYDASDHVILAVSSSWLVTDWTVADVDTSKYSGDKLFERVSVVVFPIPSVSRMLYTCDGDCLVELIDQDLTSEGLAKVSTIEMVLETWVNTSREVFVVEEIVTAVQIETEPWSPSRYELAQNFPNPFNPSTVITYSLHQYTHVEISVFNILGQHVRTLENGIHAPGVYATTWDGTDDARRPVASGIYLYRLTTEGDVQTRKMLLLK